MEKFRHWLMVILALNIIIAVIAEWSLICKIAIMLNALVLLGCIVYDLKKL